MQWALALLALCGAVHGAVAQEKLTDVQLSEFRDDLNSAFVNNQGGPGTSGGGPPMLRALVRLAFHDCASARCDGCIDTQDTRNNPGLQAMIQVLQPICNKFDLGIADCWAAAGSIAVEETSYNGPDLARVPLFFGREDAPTCTGFNADNPEALFPSAAAGYGPTIQYFQDNFNFTVNETVAILGAHSLGLASPNGSGFDGAWTISVNTLDNTFYTDMMKGQLGWGAQSLPPPVSVYQWTSVTGQQLMLNSDMCLLLDIFNETAGGRSPPLGPGIGGVAPGADTKPLCGYDDCAASPAAPVVRAYAADNSLFMTDFVAVWVKMVTKGYGACDLAVSGSVPGLPDELYRIDDITARCPPRVSGPVTTGVLGPVTTGVLGPVEPPVGAGSGGGGGAALAPEEAAGPAGGSADGPVEVPGAGLAEGPGGGPADGPGDGPGDAQKEVETADEAAAPGDAVTQEVALGLAAEAEEGSGTACMQRRVAARIAAAMLGVAVQWWHV